MNIKNLLNRIKAIFSKNKDVMNVDNINIEHLQNSDCKPKANAEFPQISRPASLRLMQQGQVRTLADIAMALNDKHHFTNLEDFSKVFEETLKDYRVRGTVSEEVLEAINYVLTNTHKEILFPKGNLDFDKLIELVDSLPYFDTSNPLDAVYSRRGKTKLLRLVAVLNDIMHYSSPIEIENDLSLLTNYCSCGSLDNSFWYPLHFFTIGIRNLWDEIQKDGYMNNDLLEEKMFTEHERKVAEFGLEEVIKQDFVQDSSCHPEVYVSKRLGTAPVYVDMIYEQGPHKPMFVKSCGEGKGPNRYDTLYETQLVEKILIRECEKGNYKSVGRGWGQYYIPLKDDSKPIFHPYEGILEKEGDEKLKLLKKLRSKMF